MKRVENHLSLFDEMKRIWMNERTNKRNLTKRCEWIKEIWRRDMNESKKSDEEMWMNERMKEICVRFFVYKLVSWSVTTVRHCSIFSCGRLMVVRGWLMVVGGWLMVVGGWLMVVRGWFVFTSSSVFASTRHMNEPKRYATTNHRKIYHK
jgi:hypothetical protein